MRSEECWGAKMRRRRICESSAKPIIPVALRQ